MNPKSGLFFFDSSFRPVPLLQEFIGVTESNPMRRQNVLNMICYEKVVRSLRENEQVLVFVHSRRETVGTARTLFELACQNNRKGVSESLFPFFPRIRLIFFYSSPSPLFFFG